MVAAHGQPLCMPNHQAIRASSVYSIRFAQIGGLIAHTVLFWGPYVVQTFKQARAKTQPDPHWQVMSRNYKEVPWYWYIGLLVLSFFAGEYIDRDAGTVLLMLLCVLCSGLIVVLKGQTTLPWWSYLISLLLGGELLRERRRDTN